MARAAASNGAPSGGRMRGRTTDVNDQTSVKAILFWNASFNKQGAVINPRTNLPRLPHGGHFSDTIDNQASSMQMM